jgi:hypothetical protein
VADCAGGQIVGHAAAKGWSASRDLHQGTPRPSPLPSLLPLPVMDARRAAKEAKRAANREAWARDPRNANVQVAEARAVAITVERPPRVQVPSSCGWASPYTNCVIIKVLNHVA